MIISHRNKTITCFLASALGGFGVHRFYLYGYKDLFAWLHLASVPVSLVAILLFDNQQTLFMSLPFILSVLSVLTCFSPEALTADVLPPG